MAPHGPKCLAPLCRRIAFDGPCCSAACLVLYRRALAAARQKAQRQRESTQTKLDDQTPVSDAYFCGGCRHLQTCADSVRGFQCTTGAYRACAPWTGAPTLKVAR